jgi:DNA primase
VAGRFRDEDLTEVRSKSPIAEIVGEYVALKNAGGGNMKGICPFHDEKSASLNVSPGKGLFHCFGCGAGGDVITFIGRIEHLSFAESVEHLAARANVTLRYIDGPSTGPRTHGQRARLIEAHAAAAGFYAQQLRTAEAAPAREFLAARGFDERAATQFGCGFAPSGWDALTKHLQQLGFSGPELELGGLSRKSSRGTLIDRFHRRLLWPIKDISGDVVGFGARRLFDDDVVDAKYLNTPETPIYKKSQLLYGADVAKREIAKTHQVVIVEGYTDVMACQLAGVTTAVATCGTAFGGEHVAVIRRLLMDSDTFRGSVIFTFDGDAAGMKAAERAFGDDQKFMAQTFVAIEPSGMDPCELRQASGDAAVRDLVARRIALVEFVLRATVGRFDLDSAEGRVAALDQGIPMVARIKDLSLRDEYARRLAGLVGVDDPNRVVARVRGLVRSDDRASAPGRPGERMPQPGQGPASSGRPGAASPSLPRSVGPKVDDAVASLEREVLKIAMQQPGLAGPSLDALLPPDAFAVAAHQQVRKAIEAAGGAVAGVSGAAWVELVGQYLPDDELRSLARSLAMEPVHAVGTDQQARYADAVFARLQEVVVSREIARVKSRLQRLNPQESADEHTRLFGELIRLEKLRRDLRERGIGGL